MDRVQYVFVLLFMIYGRESLCDNANLTEPNESVFDDDGKIVGGYSATIQSVPYQAYVLLQKGNKYYRCGGSIISNRYILTAAHCLVGIDKAHIRIGSSDCQSGGNQYTTSTFRVHPFYQSNKNDYDVALIRTDKNMKIDNKYSKIVKLPKANANVSPKTQLTVSGWGATSENGQVSRYLKAVKVPTLTNTDCKKSYGNKITDRMICAGVAQGGKDSCQGDSGGPAVANQLQLGVVSFGVGCARKGYPGVYTKVSAVRAWIKANSGV